MSFQVESSEKKRRKTENSSTPSSHSTSSAPSFSLLPDEISLNCLARISRSNYPRLSIVSKALRSLLSSKDLYVERSRLGNTEHCLYFYLWDPCLQVAQWFTIWVNPNQTLPNSSSMTTTRQMLVPIPSSGFPSPSNAAVAVVGSEIYVIGGIVDKASSSGVRVLDCRSHTWCDAPSMNVARIYASSCVYDGKIYVLGGCGRLEDWAEVFDTKTQTWERLPDPGTEIRKFSIHGIAEMEGKIKFGSQTNVYGYDTKEGKWERYENESTRLHRSGCVIENVLFYCCYENFDGPIRCYWSDIKAINLKKVKGLDSLEAKHMRNCGSSSMTKVVSFGGKLLLIWEVCMDPYPNDMKRIWCAEIMVEMRDGGEVWGNVEWVDVVHTVPTSCYLLHCLDVCV